MRLTEDSPTSGRHQTVSRIGDIQSFAHELLVKVQPHAAVVCFALIALCGIGAAWGIVAAVVDEETFGGFVRYFFAGALAPAWAIGMFIIPFAALLVGGIAFSFVQRKLVEPVASEYGSMNDVPKWRRIYLPGIVLFTPLFVSVALLRPAGTWLLEAVGLADAFNRLW